MKLAEALMERKDLTKKINRLKEEITNNITTTEGMSPERGFVQKKYEEYSLLMDKLHKINKKIDIANVQNVEQLNKLRIYDSEIEFLKKCRNEALPQEHYKYRGGEAELKRNWDIDEINQLLNALEEKRRIVDREIQKINWMTDIAT